MHKKDTPCLRSFAIQADLSAAREHGSQSIRS
jgi:hypothetical protein